MKKSSIVSRKYLDRLDRDDPSHARYIRYRRQFASAKSFIKLHARPPELKELDEKIHEKLNGGKNHGI